MITENVAGAFNTDLCSEDQSMSTTDSNPQNGIGHRRIDHERFERACEHDMTVETLAPGMALITSNDETYTVDHSGACDCADSRFRGDRYWCKHAIKFALVSIYAEGVTSAFIARVACHTAEQGCLADESGCAGPTKIGSRGFPCPTCINAVRSSAVDEWTIWTRLCEGRQ